MSGDAGVLVVSDGDGVRIAGGPVLLECAEIAAAGAVDGATWLVAVGPSGHELHRFDRAGARCGDVVALGALGMDVAIASLRVGARCALIEGERAVIVTERDGVVGLESLGERGRDRRALIGGRGVVERHGATLAWRKRGALPGFALPFDLTGAALVGGAMVLDGAAALFELDRGGQRLALVYDVRRGEVRSRIRLGDARIAAIAERKGMVVLGRGSSVAMFDLRAGCCVGERILPAPLAACAIDAMATRVIIVDEHGEVSELGASMTNPVAARRTTQDEDTVDTEVVDVDDAPGAHAGTAPGRVASAAPVVSAPMAVTVTDSTISASAMALPRPDLSELAATADSAEITVRANLGEIVTSVGSGDAHANAAERAHAPGTAAHVQNAVTADTGAGVEISAAADPLREAAKLPLEALEPILGDGLADDELEAYLGDVRRWIEALCDAAVVRARGGDEGQQAEARDRAQRAGQGLGCWHHGAAPHAELARELGLSPAAATALLLIAAPQIWGELARRYGGCVDDPARPLVDELLLAHLLDAGTADRLALAREFDGDAPLIATGAVELGRGLRPYASLAAHPAIARRLAGGGRTAIAQAAPELPELRGPRAAIIDLAQRLAQPVPAGTRARVVLRGRPGSGRRTLAAALAAQAGRALGTVAIADAAAGPELEATVRRRLRDAMLRGELPCVDLDGLADEPGVQARLRAVLDAHPGPLVLRAPVLGELPLAPGYAGLELPPLTETERAAAWRDALVERGHAAVEIAPIAASLAARFAVGAGAMLRACAALPAATAGHDLERGLATVLRQHRSARIAAVATRVETLASWDDLVVTDDIADALREVCARVRHRRLVLESWGMERAAATAQGTTALFQGGPGTGKTMAAGVIARALGFELWRVDLSKVVSKWIGETEKNLAAVFDAAEQGEIVLLFDEADSLFGKRTQVSSSNDRNANLETNYLLQRLDSFTGVAILTTNAGTAIDAAFKRRMSVHVQFPFPDEHDRERLWRAHLPARLPVHGALDLTALARKHALSGGYIRNACLRAAYLAASDGGPVTDNHLQRAVSLEYQRAGVLGGGRLE